MRSIVLSTVCLVGVLAAAPDRVMADAPQGQRSGRLATLQGRAAGLKRFFAAQGEAARRLPHYAVSQGVDAYGGLFAGLGVAHHVGGEVAFQRTYNGAGKVRPGLRLGLHAGGGLMLSIGGAFMKKVLRGKQAAGLWGTATSENAFVLGVGATHGRSAIGSDYVAGGVGAGLMVMEGGQVKSNTGVIEGACMGTVRGGLTIPLWGSIRSGWARAAARGQALAERAEALLATEAAPAPKDLARAARLLLRAEKLQKKVQRIEAKRSAEADPRYVPLRWLDSSL